MAAIPGYCTHCGHIFEGQGEIQIEHSFDVTLSDNRMTCPKCGKLARLVDGTFNERGFGLELVAGPPLTRAILDKLQELARKAESQEISPEEIIEQSETIDPKLAGALRSVPLASVASILIALVALYLSYEGNRSSSEFQSEALSILKRQAVAVEDMAESSRQPQEKLEGNLNSKRDRPANPESVTESPRVKSPSTRRRDVNKARRKSLKERRRMFPRRRPRDVK